MFLKHAKKKTSLKKNYHHLRNGFSINEHGRKLQGEELVFL